MAGGLMQLVSYGAQDIYISGNPQITFWKVLYKRHTNFAMESIEVTFNGQADFGRRVTGIISRNADLMYRTYIQVTLPQVVLNSASNDRFRWLNFVGHRLIKQVEIEIGGSRIDRQYGDWMQIWTQLSQPTGTEQSLNDMIGNTADLVLMKSAAGVPLDATCAASELTNSCVSRAGTPMKTLYIPLQFWFCRNPGLAIPLIALQYHEVRINVDFEQNYNCCYGDAVPSGTGNNGSTAYVAPTSLPQGSAATGGSGIQGLQLVAASLYIDYVYLDTEERRRFAQQSHEYLIDQLQFTGAETITASSNKIQMNFNHPVKEIVWVVQRDSFVDCSAPGGVVPWIKEALGQQPFNYSDDWNTDGIVTSILGRGQLASNVGGSTTAVSGIPTFGGATWGEPFVPGLGAISGGGLTTGSELYGDGVGNDGADVFFENTTNYLLAKLILCVPCAKCEGKNPTEVAKIQLNGQDRFSEREGRYFDKVQPWQHHTRTPSTGINVYSFALKPEEHQPSGTCNFSRIDKATLNLTVSVNTVKGQNTAQVRIYAVNYNVLRVMSGMGGLAYSN